MQQLCEKSLSNYSTNIQDHITLIWRKPYSGFFTNKDLTCLGELVSLWKLVRV